MAALMFVLGVAIHLLYLFVLLQIAPADNWNWAHADTETYLVPAQSYMRSGVFARQGEPDFFRTIGYPFFLSGALKLGAILSMDWRLVVYALHTVIFALIYPAIYFMGREVFGLTRAFSIGCAGFTLCSGAFISYVPVILSDALFATLLIAGVASGFLAVRRHSLGWGLVHVVAIVYAASVRPMLAFYPISAAGLHWAYARTGLRSGEETNRVLILAMCLFTLVGVQFSAARNWIHHGVFTPSEIASINLYEYLAKDVLAMNSQTPRYEQVQARLHEQGQQSGGLKNRISMRKAESWGVYRDYPAETAALMMHNTLLNTLEPHWDNTLFYVFRQTWYKGYGDIQQSPLPLMVALLFFALYGVVYAAALFQAGTLRKRLGVLAAVVLFLAPYLACATSYQGARFRLWFEPFVVLAAAAAFQKIHVALTEMEFSAARGSEDPTWIPKPGGAP